MKKFYKFLLAFVVIGGATNAQSGIQFNPTVYSGNVNITCNGNSDGAVSVTPTAGVSPYTYSWTGPNGFTSLDSNIAGLEAGKYYITMIDGDLIVYQDSIRLLQPDLLTSSGILSGNGTTQISCAGAADGSIDLTVAGGIAFYDYYWTGPAGFKDSLNEDLSELAPGTYFVTVTDQNGCQTTSDFVINEPAPLVIVSITSPTYYGGNNVSCYNGGDGSIDLTISGGTAPFVYNWGGPQGVTYQTQDPTNVKAGLYQITIRDANGCTAASSINLEQAAQLTAVTQPLLYNGSVNISCYGFSDGQVTLTPAGGIAPYTYDWVGPNGFTATTKDLANIVGGTYTCIVTDTLGCEFQETINLEEPDTLELSNYVVTDLRCFEDGSGKVATTVIGGIIPYTYAWTPNGITADSITNLQAGEYTFTVTDFNGCISEEIFVVNQPDELLVDLESPLKASTGYLYNVSYYDYNDGSIDADVNGGITNFYTYNWSGPKGFKDSLNEDLFSLFAGVYTLTVTDENLCIANASIELTQPEILDLPQGFSPNDDGINDNYVIHGLDAYRNNTFLVYNRFGNVVYETADYLNTWNGTNTDGDALPAGAYFVLLSIDNSNNIQSDKVLKGYVEIRR
jgi:gliding motility-associated-like protein